MYTVFIGTHRVTHQSYRSAVEHARIAEGFVFKNLDAYKHAVACQDYRGTFDAWQALSDQERDAYELGADGVPTA